MNQILPSVKPNSVFRSRLEKHVIAEFTLAQKHHTKLWLTWLIPALSLATLIMVLRANQAPPLTQLDHEMTTLEQQLLSDPQLDAAINFQEL